MKTLLVLFITIGIFLPISFIVHETSLGAWMKGYISGVILMMIYFNILRVVVYEFKLKN